MKRLSYPFAEQGVRALKAGEAVLVSGLVYTGRDRFHKLCLWYNLPPWRFKRKSRG